MSPQSKNLNIFKEFFSSVAPAVDVWFIQVIAHYMYTILIFQSACFIIIRYLYVSSNSLSFLSLGTHLLAMVLNK